jgi:hypothetical protein
MMRIRSRHFSVSGRSYLLACLFIFAAGVAQAQTDSEKKKDALELKLSTLKTTLCAGTSIDLELEIKNISQEVVKIDKADLWTQYSYSKSYPDGNGTGRAGGLASNCGDCHGNFITLFPDETYWTTYKFSLSGEFFSEAAKYHIATSVNSNTSNKLDFELIDCGKK